MSSRFVSAICELLNSFSANSLDGGLISLIEPAKKPRGHCFRALTDIAIYAKKYCHQKDTWSNFELVFEKELKGSNQTGYDFITILTAHLREFCYLSETWVMENLSNIFDRSNYIRCLCALKGYAHCSLVYQPIYEFLKKQKTLLYALDDPNLERLAKENIVHRIVASNLCLWLKLFDLLDQDTLNLVKDVRTIRGCLPGRSYFVSFEEYHAEWPGWRKSGQ